MANQPSGTVAFLFTDVEDSTSLWEQQPAAMQRALARHHDLLQAAILAHGGYVFKTVGEALQVAFPTSGQALAAALAAQRALAQATWDELGPLRVRMGLHVGQAEWDGADYLPTHTFNRVHRIMSAAHGEQIVLSEAVAELVRGEMEGAVELRDLGRHRLKGLSIPEHLFQAVAPDLPADFPPLKSLGARPNNLPLPPTPLVGREAEVTRVHELVLHAGTRLVTLTGAGGTGKTRLGLQAASDLLDDFADGVFFVNLAPLTDPALVASTIVQTLHVREQAGKSILDALTEALRDKHLLLVLDNFEHLVDAAPLVAHLLAYAPRLKVLITSRVPLHLRGEKELAVPPLALPDPKRLPPPERLTQYEAVRLFIERAQAIKHDFQVTHKNAPAVAEICVRLDGLPLAIELAAARVKLLSPQALLQRLQQRLPLLTGGSRDLPARQQTLRATIEWSYNLLSAAEQTLFRRLAVFVGGWTLQEAEGVCSDEGNAEEQGRHVGPLLPSDVLDSLESLMSKNLLWEAEPVMGEARYTMLETIREYASEQLAQSGEKETIQQRHQQVFVALAEEAEPHLKGPQQVPWLDRLEREHDNLRAALRHARDRGDVDLGVRLGTALCLRFWHIRGYWTEGREWLEGALAGSVGQSPARARAMRGVGILAEAQGDYATARARYEESLAIYQALGDKLGTAHALADLGVVARDQGDYATARLRYEESLALKRTMGDKLGIAGTLNNLGMVALSQSDLVTARAWFEESLTTKREVGDKRGIAGTLNNLGIVARDQGDYGMARAWFEESLTMAREVGDKRGVADTLTNLGHVAVHQGDYTMARAWYEECLAIKQAVGDRLGIAELLQAAAGLAGALCQAESAARLFGAAEALRQAIGTPLPPVEHTRYERDVAAVRRQLDAATFALRWTEGRAMTVEQATGYAFHLIENLAQADAREPGD